MKILVIAPARTSSTALTAYLAETKGNLINFNEQIPTNLAFEYDVYRTNNFQKLLPIIKDQLQKRLKDIFDQNNSFVIKFTGLHLKGLSHYIDVIDPQRFNEVHLLERKNFLEQACSNCVARTKDTWQNSDHDKKVQEFFEELSKKENYLALTPNFIFTAAYDCEQYLLCKKFLKEKNIVFQQHYYETPIFKSLKVGSLIKTGLDYSKLISNYSFYNESLNNYFSQYFNYETCEARYEEFVQSFDQWKSEQIKFKLKNNYYKQ